MTMTKYIENYLKQMDGEMDNVTNFFANDDIYTLFYTDSGYANTLKIFKDTIPVNELEQYIFMLFQNETINISNIDTYLTSVGVFHTHTPRSERKYTNITYENCSLYIRNMNIFNHDIIKTSNIKILNCDFYFVKNDEHIFIAENYSS